jgi:hypothetical protein
MSKTAVMFKTRVFVAGWLVLVGAAATWAYSPLDVPIEFWAATGTEHHVLVVVDFWPYNGADDGFAFGFSFDQEQVTGYQVLVALQAADLGLTFADDGGFVTDIWYVKNGTTYHTGYAWPTSYWSYWVSPDVGESWDYSLYGPVDRVLQDGDTDGWLAKPGNDETSVPVTPLRPQSLAGDLNCDGQVNFDDINPFVLALSDLTGYYVEFPFCSRLNADANHDRHVNFDDIDWFVGLLGH